VEDLELQANLGYIVKHFKNNKPLHTLQRRVGGSE
jgi:hypothetical protein